jgi:hypothetical protein
MEKKTNLKGKLKIKGKNPKIGEEKPTLPPPEMKLGGTHAQKNPLYTFFMITTNSIQLKYKKLKIIRILKLIYIYKH